MASKSEAFIDDDDFFWEDDIHHDNTKGDVTYDLDREWKARHNEFHTVGYREGLLAAKELSVQEGFNNGFKESVLVGYNWGLVRGITSSFACLPEHVKEKLVETSEDRTKLETLHQRVHSVSGNDALKLFHEDVMKGRLEAQPSNSKESAQVKAEGGHQMLKVEERVESCSSASDIGKLADFHGQLVSTLATTTLKTACSSQ
uniref:Essential protein Yae1 N-terminal domain-containing protein n=1 Tax=Araucaria cunninghamii TaxID=56994 RepID=A0A0D6QSR7_ARACU